MRAGRVLIAAVLLAACSSAGQTESSSVVVQSADVQATTSTTALAPDAPRTSRVLLIGDSTLLAIEKYDTFSSLRGFGFVYEAESCRTLGVQSCGSRPKPTNSVEAIEQSQGPFDVVVVMAGYDEWWTSFPSSFDAVVSAARAQGAGHVVWLTYREDVTYEGPNGAAATEAYVKNNAALRSKIADPAFADVVLLDWNTYSNTQPAWLADDGIHLTPLGAQAVADYISQAIANLDHRSCPGTDDGTDSVCPNPDLAGG